MRWPMAQLKRVTKKYNSISASDEILQNRTVAFIPEDVHTQPSTKVEVRDNNSAHLGPEF
jgi:hypothetical protein